MRNSYSALYANREISVRYYFCNFTKKRIKLRNFLKRMNFAGLMEEYFMLGKFNEKCLINLSLFFIRRDLRYIYLIIKNGIVFLHWNRESQLL